MSSSLVSLDISWGGRGAQGLAPVVLAALVAVGALVQPAAVAVAVWSAVGAPLGRVGWGCDAVTACGLVRSFAVGVRVALT